MTAACDVIGDVPCSRDDRFDRDAAVLSINPYKAELEIAKALHDGFW